jgi:hypothetical protein
MYSLRKRIARNLAANLLAVMIGLLIAMHLFAQQLLHDYILTHLQHDAESLASVIYRDPAQGWKIDPGRMSTVYNRVRSGHYYYVAIDGQAIISRSLFDADFPGIGDNHRPGSDFLADGPGDERWMIWHQRVTKNGQAIGIWIAEDIAPFQARLLRYSAANAGLIAIVAAVLFYLQQRSLRQAFVVFDWLRTNLTAIRQKETEGSGVSVPLEIAGQPRARTQAPSAIIVDSAGKRTGRGYAGHARRHPENSRAGTEARENLRFVRHRGRL